MVSASTAKKTEQPVEELLKIVSTKGVKQRTSTNQEEKQQGLPKSVLASTVKKSDQLKKEDLEKRVSTMDQIRRKKLLV
nr:hypothetical protein CFP56_27166 [Quercus suber]